MLYVLKGNALVPVSYEARGAAIPFNTPLLSQARARIEADGKLYFLIPGLAETTACYVVPAEKLSRVVTVSLRDRALIDALSPLPSLDPVAVRRVCLEIDQTGIGGTELQSHASAEIAADHAAQSLFWHTTVRFALGSAVGAPTEGHGARFDPQAAFVLARQLELRFKREGIDPNDGEKLIATLAELAAPALARSGGPLSRGVLVRILDRLNRLSAELDIWAETESTHARVIAEGIRDRITVFMGKITGLLIHAEGRFSSMMSQLPPPKREVMALTQDIKRIWWVQDGWRRVSDRWDRATEESRHGHRAALEDMALLLPVEPLSELSQEEAERMKIGRDLRLTALASAAKRRKPSSLDLTVLAGLEVYKTDLVA